MKESPNGAPAQARLGSESRAVSEFAGKSQDSCVACSWNTFLWIPSCPKHPRAGLPAVQLGALKPRSKLLSREFSGSGFHTQQAKREQPWKTPPMTPGMLQFT
ncbi:unnamed protein product [Leuciscus chuanchicus]